MTCRRLAPIAILSLAVVSCAASDDLSTSREHATAAAARTEMVGLTRTQLRMCAGFPSETVDAGDSGEIWSYRASRQRGNMSVALPAASIGVLPAVGGSINMSSSGFCHTQVRLVDGIVAEVEFSGDGNRAGTRNALCSTMVDSCVNYARRIR